MALKTTVVLLFLLGNVRFSAENNTKISRFSFFETLQNRRLNGYVAKRFDSPSLLSCGHQCLINTWCTSTNFKFSFKGKDKGTCELNKHDTSTVNENNNFFDDEETTLSMLLKGCQMTSCLNGGSCIRDIKRQTFSCACQQPWIGERCHMISLGACGGGEWTLVMKISGFHASLQPNCSREGFNVKCDGSGRPKARIGILGNNENDCNTCDSRVGFGTGGKHDDSNTCGSEAKYGNIHIKAMGYILLKLAIERSKLLLFRKKADGNKAYSLHISSDKVPVYCHMTSLGACGGYGWTLVMKMNGSLRTFHYDDDLWSNKKTFNLEGGKTGLDSNETKLPTYWNTPFTRICLGMKIGEEDSFIAIDKPASSLYSLIADGKYRATSLGRNSWKRLIGSRASLQRNCNKEGFNVVCTRASHSKARIGYIGNQESNCGSCDSRIGFGTGGNPDDSNTCGNQARHNPDNSKRHITAMGYISRTFHYDSNLWSNNQTYNVDGGKTGFDSQETKLPTYWNSSFTKICLGMKIEQHINFILFNRRANSLYSLIADGNHCTTSLGRDNWMKLIGSQASLQPNCNREGFNVKSDRSGRPKARIGILGNNENECNACDSRIGFGTGGIHDDSSTCGNEAKYGNIHIKAMGYILIQ
ncbi:uncharacterized protein LOC111346988 [Stylophora pistillata]|uniref:uncharacterized protein LOC111346988 n=1 Tax=Stylophora pistillata TaxID=50429 RepID=UPI000C0437BA|nr:uncharacterized protein LOC111346988 [Stylophora pistillata]